MKVKLDENLPARLAPILAHLGHQIDTVPQEGLTGRDDAEIWEAAQAAGCFLITQDLDFSDVRRFIPGTHCGLLLVRLRIPSRHGLVRRIHDLFKTEPVETWKHTFVLVTDHKLRVRRPQQT